MDNEDKTLLVIIALTSILFTSGILYKFFQGDFDSFNSSKRNIVTCGTDFLYRLPPNSILYDRYIELGGKDSTHALLGKELFDANCKQCHSIHEILVGPALEGVLQRRKVKWLLTFIKNPEDMIKKKDKAAVAMYQKYKQYMPNHDFLSDDQILAILVYIEGVSR